MLDSPINFYVGIETENIIFDFVIAGAGASGLFLALEMAEQGLLNSKTLCLIDRDSEKSNDRTWCFWSKSQLPYYLEQSISCSWLQCMSEDVLQELKPYKYYHIRSEDFYKKVYGELSKYPQITQINDNIHHVIDTESVVEIVLDKGRIKTQKLFNSIPILDLMSAEEPVMWQSFYGWRLKFNSPHKNKLNLKLMDFDIPQSGSTQFVYVLPLDNNSALIELTRFGSEVLDSECAKVILQDYINRLSMEYTIEEEEISRIPMSQLFDAQTSFHPHDQKIIPIGTAAGALKSSTGYGFLKMYHHAVSMTEAMHQGRPLPTIYRKKRFRLYDALLLRILYKEPLRARPIFKQLFKGVPTPLILKFLDEGTNLLEEAKIFLQLPVSFFIKHLLNYGWDKKRRLSKSQSYIRNHNYI